MSHMAYLHVCINIAPGANVDNNRIQRDLFLSHDIWYPISFHIKKMIMLDQTFRFHDQEISYSTPFRHQPKVWRLLENYKSACPNASLYITYIGGNYFKEPHVIGCAYSEASGPLWKGHIFITNTAASVPNKLTLAHEIGHILLTQRKNGVLTNIDPHSPTGSQHHPSPNNLMYPVVPSLPHAWQRQHLLTEEQRFIASQSPLLRG